ncbi:MAG TPA: cytochrome c3 family protein [Phycisphaerae bacterium]|nr:cytochrome c3 family protein [Phycisphaerae bacterium]HNU44939.1 cytochrome c3 family protein [Phycisphaerae bacterium]
MSVRRITRQAGTRQWTGLTLAAALCLANARLLAQDNDDCFKCHGSPELKTERDGRSVSLFVDPARYEDAIHVMDCVDCHQDLSGVDTFPHARELARVDCGQCHEDDDGPIARYWGSAHGERVKAENPHAPRCQDCHGDHYILPLSHPRSAVSPFNIPLMCGRCHAEGAPVERAYELPQEQVFQRYRDSIHGVGLFQQGLTVTAVCTSCHGGHHILPHTDPRSSIHKNNVVATCMQCHGLIEEVHRKVVAGELWEKQGVVPICVECHSPHEVRKVFYDTNMSNADCLRCHADRRIAAEADGRSLFVDAEEHQRSIHGRKAVSCAQCHTGATPSLTRSCATITDKVNCAVCHAAQVDSHQRSTHGMLAAAGDPNAPACTDCHGRHDTLEHTVTENAPLPLRELVRGSPTFSRNVPLLCARCHRTGAPAAVRSHTAPQNIIESYRESIHGKGLGASGLTVTAMCSDCHTAHQPLPRSNPSSSVHPANLPSTCGRCHDGVHEQFMRSIHSREGNPSYVPGPGQPGLPGCADCHASHAVVRADVPEFKRAILDQCGHCHEELTRTYFDTYHGQASALRATAAAKCSDCHGAHDILPPANPESHLSRQNIVATCGKCHPGSHRRFAGYLTHATHHDPHRYPALHYTYLFMTTLLVGTFSFFWLHTLLWLPRSWKMRRQRREAMAAVTAEGPYVQRFTPLHRVLHLIVILSFFGLAVTGMMIKFSYAGWAAALAGALGGVETAGWIHRVCAVATFGYFVTHVWDLRCRQRRGGGSWFKFLFGPDTMLPTWRDVREFGQTVKWFLGLGSRPHYGRWTYWEKFDYFAVFWGVAIIGSTGLCLWFPVFFTRFLPGWSINVAQLIHSDEALLATGFIFTVHFFNSHFRPDKFPMDTVVFTGSMPLDEFRHDRPREYEELTAAGGLAARLEPAPPLGMTRAARVFGGAALLIGLTLIGLIIYAMIFAYR